MKSLLWWTKLHLNIIYPLYLMTICVKSFIIQATSWKWKHFHHIFFFLGTLDPKDVLFFSLTVKTLPFNVFCRKQKNNRLYVGGLVNITSNKTVTNVNDWLNLYAMLKLLRWNSKIQLRFDYSEDFQLIISYNLSSSWEHKFEMMTSISGNVKISSCIMFIT